MTELNRCKNCYYSETIKVLDPVLDVINKRSKLLEEIGLSSTTTLTMCHYAGKPQMVNADRDWCHQWKEEK